MIDVSGDKIAEFKSRKSNFSIPFAKVTSLEYGQKAGRRVGAALVVSPVLLLSKKRKHFLTITFEDAAGAKQGVVIEIGKDHVRSIATTFRRRRSMCTVNRLDRLAGTSHDNYISR